MCRLPIGKFDPPFNPHSVFCIAPDAQHQHVAIFGKSGTWEGALMGNTHFSNINIGLGGTMLGKNWLAASTRRGKTAVIPFGCFNKLVILEGGETQFVGV